MDGPKMCTVNKNIFQIKKKKEERDGHPIHRHLLQTGIKINGHVLVVI